VKLLLDKGAETEAKDDRGCTPLLWAAHNGHDTVVKLLLDKGADVGVKDGYGRTPLWMAVGSGCIAPSGKSDHFLLDYQLQLMLLEQQNKKRLLMARQEQSDTDGALAINQARAPAEPGEIYEAIIKLLLDKGADIEAKNNGGTTPLLCAFYSGCKAIVKLLLDKGADIDAKDNDGQSPLSLAKYWQKDTAKLLLDKKAVKA
jgi:hypothetical protein